MKQQIKNGIIFGLTAGIVFTLFGVVYAAWNDVVSNGDTVSASSWNTLVGKVGDMDNAVSFSGSTIQVEEICDETGSNCQDISADWASGSGSSGTSAFLEGLPDALVCNGVHFMSVGLSGSNVYYRHNNGSPLDISYNSTTGAYVNTNTGASYSDCIHKPLSQLTSEGHARYFGNDIGSIAQDDDNDTKIMVEKNSDEDKIRFDTAGSEKMVINEVGKVGVGTTNPTTDLQVGDGVGNRMISVFGADNAQNGIQMGASSKKRWSIFRQHEGDQNDLWIYEDHRDDGGTAAARVVVKKGGNVGIGTISPTAKLSVNGSANKSGGGSWATYSDVRLKDIQGDYTKGLSEILELHPVEFNYKEDNILGWDSEKTYQGLIAQEVQTTFPEAVTQSSNSYLELDTLSIDMALINAIQELKSQKDTEIEELKARIESLENK